MKINVGDSVSYTTFSGHTGAGVIENIQVCEAGEKYGYEVPSADLQETPEGTLCLSDGHWCYFSQIQRLLNQI